jgi:hypothetical protein
MLLASGLGVILICAVTLFAEVGIRNQHSTAKATDALTQQRVGLERMTREIRQATSFTLINSQVVELSTYVHQAYDGTNATLRRVRYDCSNGEVCRRSEGPVGGAFTAVDVEIVNVVNNTDVFDPRPVLFPTWVGITLRVRAEGEQASARRIITLRDGVDLRNVER